MSLTLPPIPDASDFELAQLGGLAVDALEHAETVDPGPMRDWFELVAARLADAADVAAGR